MRLLLLLFLVVTTSANKVPDNAPQSADLNRRMDKLQHMVLNQDLRLSSQESLLRQQVDVIQRQKAQLLNQEDLIRQLYGKLSHQEIVNQQQQNELAQHKSLLRKYSKSTLNETKLKAHKSMITETIQIHSKRAPNLPLPSNNLSDLNTLQPKEENVDGAYKLSGLNASQTEEENKNDDTLLHVVEARADDSDPLMAVVDQMSQRMTEMEADIHALKNTAVQQQQTLVDARTSTFTHWGSSRCADASQLVYSGVMGGSWYNDTGAATNYLCMTMSPVAGHGYHHERLVALLYGVEFQTLESHQNKDPVCSVCRSTYSTTIMIPGTNECMAGWHRQYSGFIMAGYHDYPSGSEYICVDSHLETQTGGNDDRNGRLLDFTLARCGSLPCEPYVNGTVVTCAVCSK